MEKQKIYFVQTGCVFNNEYFLPYAAGIIAAYAFQNEKIKTHFELADLIYKCENYNDTLSEIKNPDVVAFSNYMWNFEFNLRLANDIKQKYKSCKIIFGGHQIEDTEKWLKQYSVIDFAVVGEGERIVSEILLKLCTDGDFSTIDNISYRCENKILTNKRRSIVCDINELPSPYLTGVFDKIIKNNNDKFAAVIETSRGCPYHCAYCDWGDYDLPMRFFDVDRVKKEIEYLGKKSVVFVVLADSNFGIREDDVEIAEEFVRAKKQYGYPKGVEIAFAKHNPDRVFAINKKLYENNMSRGATLSMQSLDPVALKNIGRENITKEKFSELLRLYAENNIPSYTELILGLPGETYESFCNGIEYLLDNGQHNSIHVFYCEILPNALMGTEQYKQKHSIKNLERNFVLRNGINLDGIGGKSNIITETETMSKDMFLKSMQYAFTVQVFHNFGLCRVVAIYFHYEKGMKYCDFYNALIEWINKNPERSIGKIFNRFYRIYEMSVVGTTFETYENPSFGKTQFNLSDGAFLESVCMFDEVYSDLKDFIAELSEDSHINEEILRFQRMIIRKPDNKCSREKFEFDWVKYYIDTLKKGKSLLEKKSIYLTIEESQEYNDLISFSEVVAIKGRRTGKSIALNDADSYTLEYIDEDVKH